MKTKILSIAVAFLALTANAQINRPMPKPGPSPVVNLGKPSEFKLSNGLTVIVVENHKLPRVSATLSIDNKPFALGDKKGADDLLGGLLGTGTTKLSKDDFNNKVEQLGARVSYSDGGGRVSSLSKYFNEVFGYFAEGALNPKFTQAEFDALKARTIEALKSDEKNVSSAASRMGSVFTYGKNHPFSEFETEEKIKNLSLADVENYYKKYYVPNNAYLIFVGDITPAEAKKLSEKHFSGWKKTKLNIADLPKVAEVSKTEIAVVNMPNAVQSVVEVNYPVTLTKKDPDFYAVQVASTILGGDFNSRLNMNLREKHGWTYGARGGVVDSRYAGRFYTSATVRNSVTDSAVVETIKEMRGMTLNKIDNQELENVKAKFLGNFVLSLERPETVASHAFTKKTNQLSDDFYANYIQNINKVTVDDVLRVSKKYFRPEQAKIVVTGKAEEIGEGLKKLGYPVSFFDAYGNPIEDPAKNKKQANVTAQQIAENYIKAIGGKANVDKVKTVLQSGKISMMGMEGEYVAKNAFPDKVNSVIKIMGAEIKNVFDGNKGYASQMGNRMDMDAKQIAAMKGQNNVFPVLSVGFADSKVDGIVNLNGNDHYKVVNTAAKKVEYYDVKTGLLSKVETTTSTPQGDITSIANYNEYKTFDGVLFATVTEMQVGPQTFKITLDKVEVNKNVSDADFQ